MLEFTVHRPLKTGGLSESALFRSLSEGSVTLLWDEVGVALGEANRDRNSSLGAVLLNGFARGTPVMRCLGERSRQVVTPFDVFGPMVLSGTGRLTDAITDRCLLISLKRKAPSERVERVVRREAGAVAEPLRARMAAWSAAQLDELSVARPNLPNELDDRARDIAECLVAIADVAGEEWPRRARHAVIGLRGGVVDDDELGVELLADIRKAFDDNPSIDRLATDELILAICKDKERPWATDYRATRLRRACSRRYSASSGSFRPRCGSPRARSPRASSSASSSTPSAATSPPLHQ
jgi:hypothetical protein